MRIGAARAAYGGRSGGGKKRQEQGAVEREDKEDKSQDEGGEGEEERADKRRLELGRERLGKQRTRGAEAPDGNVRGRGGHGLERPRPGLQKGEGAAAARKGKENTHKSKEGGQRGQEEKESGGGRRRRRRSNGQAHETGLEHPGKMGARTRRTEWWRPWTGVSGVGAALDWSVRGCIRRKKQRRRGAHAQEQGTVEREITKNKSREAGGEGEDREADNRMGI